MTLIATDLPAMPKPASAPAPPVPIMDLKAQYRTIQDEVLDALREVAESTAYVLGPKVADFEQAFADYVGSRFCVGVNSGTSALHLALICAGVRPGDEVITVPMTFVATTWAVSYIGARPVFVDVDPITYTMDLRQVERKITRRTKAILPVHLYGQPADMEGLLDLGRRRGIPVIEDAAQAHGAAYDGRGAGTMGLCGCFSFYPGKNLGAYGEAGAITTDDEAVAARLRKLRDHAQGRRYHHDELGYNYRMDGFQGAVLGVKLKHLDRWTESRRRLADRYLRKLATLPLKLPVEAPGRRHVWHLFVALHPHRDRIRSELEAAGIQTGLHYPVPVHLQEAYADLEHRPGDFPIAERVASDCFSLPLFPEMTDEQQDRVVAALRDALTRDREDRP
ncbi:dTDP-3-amino-3,6-dideoxy-alpha-D-galactopyranose transaminase [Aquisphaera giovannonii]|uniref:dTDP-3-amino-3,6-dideoxy-alpha-D-galactopyranose transaminase n=1 Tax=Aquisphaera giovannonii TaxID=406548 RepID=A0A5B9WC55_9BACT|nr:DegT/DnrJ/EryC1/StrS family aminotransferase [Aquisphaera giovannonii]QEH37854.1 dTDP-3-amino-3,6-dideoxy-alpha-D-galactopyranose transaminase [Aquisphaera giovannonii]